MSPIAIAFALAAAVCLAGASSLQHHAATGQSDYRSGAHLLRRLARSPRWVAGFLISALGLGLHAVALRFGDLAVVQPLLVSSLVFALPLRAMLDRRRPCLPAIGAAVVVAGGLTVFLLAAHPTSGHTTPTGSAAAVICLAAAVATGLCSALATRTSNGVVAGLSLGLATGILYGLVGGALKATVHVGGAGPVALLTSWPLWALLVAGGWALVVNQRAYTRAPLSVSLPMLTVVNPIVAVAFGAFVYAEKPADQPLMVVLQVLGLVALTAAVAVLARRERDVAADAAAVPAAV